MQITITIEGFSPLMLCRFTDAAALSASSGTSLANSGGSLNSPKESAEEFLYKGSDGETLIFPGPNIFSNIIEGGKFHKAGKSKITTLKSSLIPSCMMVDDIEIPIESEEGWQVDTRPVRIPATGGRILRHRPLFNDWKLTFSITLDESFISVKLMRQIIDDAGSRIGLGAFRPACKGPYGRYKVIHWNSEKEKALKLAAFIKELFCRFFWGV